MNPNRPGADASPGSLNPSHAEDAKRFAAARSEAAHLGCELQALGDGSYRLSRSGLGRSLAGLSMVEAFLRSAER